MPRSRAAFTLILLLAACKREQVPQPPAGGAALPDAAAIAAKVAQYATVTLTTDTAALTKNERRMIPLLIDAAREMDPVFWRETYGDRADLMRHVTAPDTRRFVHINYGPWDRLENNAPFVPEIGSKPAGANFYPRGMTKGEFDSVAATSKSRGDSLRSLYTIIGRDGAGQLTAAPYSKIFAAEHERAAIKLLAAAALADDPGLKRYLTLRAAALRNDDYQPSDFAWMQMQHNTLDIIIGPVETYEDELFGYKAAHEGLVVVKDQAWSRRLARYGTLLPSLQRSLPVPAAYKAEKPATGSDLNAYDALFYAGEANSGVKSIAVNLPNDEAVQLKLGSRRLQLKNVMRAKFDVIMMPLAKELVVADQIPLITFDAFFENVMFHEVAHGLGIHHTLKGTSTVRVALKERASAFEEEKADIVGLHMVQELNARGELGKENVQANYVTFLASIFRSMRFSAADAHGRANIVSFNFLYERGAFARDSATGRYRVDVDKFRTGMNALAEQILRFQGDGDYAGAGAFAARYGAVTPETQRDLARLGKLGVPVDVVFAQDSTPR